MGPRPSGTRRRRCNTVRPGVLGQSVLFLGAAACALAVLTLVALGLSMLGRPALAVASFAIAAFCLFLAVFCARAARAPARGRLTLVVCPDAVSFVRHGAVVDRLEREEVGLIVIDEYGTAGVGGVDVWGPDRQLIGKWDTEWLARSRFRLAHALRRHGYPWLVAEGTRIIRRGGRNVPAWAEEVV
jgi:hypothetical protein